MKKALCILLSLMLCLTACGAFAAQMGSAWIVEGRTITLSGTQSVPGDLHTYLSEKEVNQIEYAILSDGVSGIEEKAFAGFPHLKLIVIPATVLTAGKDFLGSENVTCQIKCDQYQLQYLVKDTNPEYMDLLYQESKPAATAVPDPDDEFQRLNEKYADVPVRAVIQEVVDTLLEKGLKEVELDDISEHGKYGSSVTFTYYVWDGEEEYKLNFSSENKSVLDGISVTTETLRPGNGWKVICRTIPTVEILDFPEKMCSILAEIELVTDGSYAKANGWDIQVGTVMDVRSYWSINRIEH